MFLGFQDNLISLVSNTREELENCGIPFTSIEETKEIYTLHNGKYIAEKEIEEAKRKELDILTCTKRELCLALKTRGITYNQVKELVNSNEDAQLEWELCSVLQRGNPLLDVMSAKLGVTPEDLDNIFKEINNIK